MQTGQVFSRVLLVVFTAVLCSLLSFPDSDAAQAGCENQCVQRANVCVQEADECVQTEQVCTQTRSECIQTKRMCSLYNMKTGACVEYENRCVSKADRCVQKQNVCKKKQKVCKKYQEKCVKEQQVCKSPNKVQPAQSCAACNANRQACHSQCSRSNDLIVQNRCVTSCNAKFECILGLHCR